MQFSHEDIINAIQKVSPFDDPTQLRTNIKLVEQGLDSLDLFSVILTLQETHGINIPDEDVDGLDTIETLLSYLNTHAV